MKQILFLFCLSLWAGLNQLQAQPSGTNEVTVSALEEFMFADGKIKVVLAVVLIIVIGVVGYGLYLRGQLKHWQKQADLSKN
jgi:Tfp pilus assembly protein PilO